MTVVIRAGASALPSAAGPIDIRPLRPEDLPGVLAMLRRCSAATRYRRFHGFSDGVDHARGLVAAPSETVVAFEGGRCIGLATLAAGEDDHELGVLVEDDRQRHGVGTRLVGVLVGAARARRVRHLRAEVLGDDAHLLVALGRLGPMRVVRSFGVSSAVVELAPAPGALGRSR